MDAQAACDSEGCVTDSEVIDVYHRTVCEYDAAKNNACRRIEAFTDLLVAERILMSRLGIGGVPHLDHYRARCYP
jgi:hypothetical protein